MKLRRIIVLFMLFAMALSVSAFADIAYEPNDNFYSKYRDECKYENRVWITNGAEGYVIGYASPTGDASVALPNGNEYYVSYTWVDDGQLWGCVEYDPTSLESAWQDAESAWVDMGYMTPRYDSESFLTDHEDDISSEERIFKIAADEEVVTYRYPGSGIVTGSIGNYSSDEYATAYLSNIYTDAEGREWGHCGYYFGHRNFWVCISEPYTELAAGAEFTEPEIIPAADETAMNAALKGASDISLYAVAGAVGAVVIAGAIAAYIIIRKRRAE